MNEFKLAFAGVVIVAVLTSCDSRNAAQKAEQEYSFLEANKASPDELCGGARKVQDAYRELLNSEKYQYWKLTADIMCRRADQLKKLGV